MNRGHQQQAEMVGPIRGAMTILWDMENCNVPSDVKADDVASNVRKALRQHEVIQGAVTSFAAYGDFSRFSRKVREGCQRTGVNLIDVPNGKKDASDKAILVDLFLFALDNPPPCTIFLISGDVDFSSALHKLGQRGYTVVLAVPSGVGVSPALLSAGRFVWDWPSLARAQLHVAKHSSFNRANTGHPWPSSRGVMNMGMREGRLPEGVSGGGGRAEIIDMSGFSGHTSSAWPVTDDSDFTANEEERVEERLEERLQERLEERLEEQIVWKKSTFEDHSVSISKISNSRFDAARRTSNGSPHRRTSNVSPAASRRTSSGISPRRGSNVSPAASRRQSNASPARGAFKSSPARSRNSTASPATRPWQSPAVRPTIPMGGKPQDVVVARELGKFANSARAVSPSPFARGLQAEATVRSPVYSKDGSLNAGSATVPQISDLHHLKEQVLKLLSHNRGEMELARLPNEYLKQFGESFPDFGPNCTNLATTLDKFPQLFTIKGKGPLAVLCLTRSGGRAAGKLKKDPKSGRNVGALGDSVFQGTAAQARSEEEDMVKLHDEEELAETQNEDLAKAPVEDLANPMDEIAGEEVLLGRRTQSIHQALSVELQAQNVHAVAMEMQALELKSSSQTTNTNREISEVPEEKQSDSRDDWDMESARLSYDEHDDEDEEEEDEDMQEEKDVECDESILEVVVLGAKKASAGSGNLDMFKMELQNLLISHAWHIELSDFLEMYKQRYSRQLDYVKFGVEDLEALIGKVGDVATVVTEKNGDKVLVGL